MKFFRTLSAVLLIVICCQTKNSNAQMAFEEGKSYASLGYGYEWISPKSIFNAFDNNPAFKVKGFGPLTLKYEYAVSEKIGIGLGINYTSASIGWDDTRSSLDANGNIVDSAFTYNNKYSKLTITPRISFHFGGESEMFDPYVVIGAGFKAIKYSYETKDPIYTGIELPSIPFSFNLAFGTRVMFTESIGIFGEFGAGQGIFQAGGTFKF
jgi:outer membrane protein W